MRDFADSAEQSLQRARERAALRQTPGASQGDVGSVNVSRHVSSPEMSLGEQYDALCDALRDTRDVTLLKRLIQQFPSERKGCHIDICALHEAIQEGRFEL